MLKYGETSRALKRKEKIGLKLELIKCGKTWSFFNFYGIFCFQIAFKFSLSTLFQKPLKLLFSEKKITKIV